MIAVGYRAENALAAELEEMGCPCVRVGDCASVGKILTAIESGFQAGCSIKYAPAADAPPQQARKGREKYHDH